LNLLYKLHGYAIASEDDFIADKNNEIPEALKFPADQEYFREELDKAQLVIMGSVAHRMFPNEAHRHRLVLTSKADGLVRDQASEGIVHKINPVKMPLLQALQNLVPEGGRIAVPGGAEVIEACWPLGFSCFHLTRVEGLKLCAGKKLFRECEAGRSADEVLCAHGLQLKKRRSLGAPLVLCSYE
jgi:dihydrofolate reductase